MKLTKYFDDVCFSESTKEVKIVDLEKNDTFSLDLDSDIYELDHDYDILKVESTFDKFDRETVIIYGYPIKEQKTEVDEFETIINAIHDLSSNERVKLSNALKHILDNL